MTEQPQMLELTDELVTKYTEAFGVDERGETHSITLYLAPEGYRLDVGDEYSASRGSTLFDAVVTFGRKYKPLKDSLVPESERWATDNTPPDVTVLSQENPAVREALHEIRAAVKEGGPGFETHLNPFQVDRYRQADMTIGSLQKPPSDDDIAPVAIVRAGIAGLLHTGIPYDKHILIEEKRLNYIADKDVLATGFRFHRADLARIKDKTMYIRELAFATGSSAIALDYLLMKLGQSPRRAIWASTVAAQQGLEVAKEYKQVFDRDIVFLTGGLAERLTGGAHPFYIQYENGDFAVGDGGDITELLIPHIHWLAYESRVTQHSIELLQQLDPDVQWGIHTGEEVTLPMLMKLCGMHVIYHLRKIERLFPATQVKNLHGILNASTSVNNLSAREYRELQEEAMRVSRQYDPFAIGRVFGKR